MHTIPTTRILFLIVPSPVGGLWRIPLTWPVKGRQAGRLLPQSPQREGLRTGGGGLGAGRGIDARELHEAKLTEGIHKSVDRECPAFRSFFCPGKHVANIRSAAQLELFRVITPAHSPPEVDTVRRGGDLPPGIARIDQASIQRPKLYTEGTCRVGRLVGEG